MKHDWEELVLRLIDAALARGEWPRSKHPERDLAIATYWRVRLSIRRRERSNDG